MFTKVPIKHLPHVQVSATIREAVLDMWSEPDDQMDADSSINTTDNELNESASEEVADKVPNSIPAPNKTISIKSRFAPYVRSKGKPKGTGAPNQDGKTD